MRLAALVSGEMSPQEIGAFTAVIVRAYGSIRSDNADTVLDVDGRVKERHLVMFNYNAGGGEKAINSQVAPTTESCMDIIMQFEYERGLDMALMEFLFKLISDNCCAPPTQLLLGSQTLDPCPGIGSIGLLVISRYNDSSPDPLDSLSRWVYQVAPI